MLVFWKKLWLPYSSREDMFSGYRTASKKKFYCGCPCLNWKQLSYHSLSTASRRPCYLAQQWIASILSSPPLPCSPPSTVSTSLRLAGTEQRHIALSMHSYSNCIWVELSGWSWHLADWPFHIWAYFRENALNVSLQLIVWNSSMGKRSESAKRPGPKQLAYRIAHCTKHSFTTPLIFIYYN